MTKKSHIVNLRDRILKKKSHLKKFRKQEPNPYFCQIPIINQDVQMQNFTIGLGITFKYNNCINKGDPKWHKTVHGNLTLGLPPFALRAI